MAKIRVGFVANSSSSSYVLLVDKEKFEEVTKSLDPNHRLIVEALATYTSVLGQDCAVFHDLETQGESSLLWDFELPEGVEPRDPDCPSDTAWDAFYKFKDAVKETLSENDYFISAEYNG